MAINLVDGVPGDSINVDDRGLAYGDGVFRTLTLRAGKPVLWQRQYAKLAADCAALAIVCPEPEVLERDIAYVAARTRECVVKIIVTRGASERGYAPPAAATPRRILSASPLPQHPRAYYDFGVRVRLCRTRLAAQPALAGVKHLNRLENVLARAEWNDRDTAEGLMRDMDGHVIGGTMTNLFAVRRGVLLTPDLTRCGVAGLTRDLVIEWAERNAVEIKVTRLRLDDVVCADEVFLVNSAIGIWQVAVIGDKSWARGTLGPRIRNWLNDAQT